MKNMEPLKNNQFKEGKKGQGLGGVRTDGTNEKQTKYISKSLKCKCSSKKTKIVIPDS